MYHSHYFASNQVATAPDKAERAIVEATGGDSEAKLWRFFLSFSKVRKAKVGGMWSEIMEFME
jgi:hypothetical protein